MPKEHFKEVFHCGTEHETVLTFLKAQFLGTYFFPVLFGCCLCASSERGLC